MEHKKNYANWRCRSCSTVKFHPHISKYHLLTFHFQMPPKDESAAYALDDAILFSRIFTRYLSEPLPQVFAAYEAIRRKPIDDAYKLATANWAQNRDSTSLTRRLEDWLTPWNLRRTRKARTEAWMADAQTVAIPFPEPGQFQSKDDTASETSSWLT